MSEQEQGVQPKAASVDHDGYGKCGGTGRVWVDAGQASNWYEGGSCETCRSFDAKLAERLTKAASPGQDERDALARIIEPGAWAVYDECGNDLAHPYLDQKIVIKGAVESSLTRADAILSRPPVRAESPVAWFCKACNSPRAIAPCQKCNGALQAPADGWEWPDLPDIDRIRALAREVGYGIGVHGSLERDLDLIAIPWSEGAVSPPELAAHIARGLPGRVLDDANQDKPSGRWSCNISPDGWFKMIDLSVMPPVEMPR